MLPYFDAMIDDKGSKGILILVAQKADRVRRLQFILYIEDGTRVVAPLGHIFSLWAADFQYEGKIHV
jgi:hypothetical protein